jgi:hypothetical protein
MPEVTKVSLNAGELSDEMAGRPDLSKFQMGCEVAENVRILRVGGQQRRAGFEYVNAPYDQSKKSRLQGFHFGSISGDDQGYCFEFSDYKMRVIRNGELITNGSSPAEFTTPWSEDQVFALQFSQRTDRIIVTHPDVEVHTITRGSQGQWDWSIEIFPWQERVWVDPFLDGISLIPSATTGNISITSSAHMFDSSWVGTRLKIVHPQPEDAKVSSMYAVWNPDLADPDNYDSSDRPHTFNASGKSYSTAVNTAGGDDTRAYVNETEQYRRTHWRCIADYDKHTDYVSGKDHPSDYPSFFALGIVIIPSTFVKGDWEFETKGDWRGQIVIQRSYDNGANWVNIKTMTSAADKNFILTETEDTPDGAYFRVLVTEAYTSYNRSIIFTVKSTDVEGVAKITSINHAASVDATVEALLGSTNTTSEWYEEAFSPKNGYPFSSTFHQKRLVFGGSKTRPQTIWTSVTEQPYNFTKGTEADSGMVFETEAFDYEEVYWTLSHLSLLVGTSSGVWAITSPDGRSLTPENSVATRQVKRGSQKGVAAVAVDNNVLFLQRKGRKIHELTGGSVEYGGYLSVDLTQLASHITRNGVDQVAAGEVPDSSLYVVTGGELAVLTYERNQNVVGWARWVTDGIIESVATCPGGGEDDDVYIVVNRAGTRTIEFLSPDMLRVEEANDAENLVHLDSCIKKYEVAAHLAFNTVEGLAHLEGRTVEAFLDGEPQGELTVSGGQVTLPNTGLKAVVGLPYTSVTRPMPIDLGGIGSKNAFNEVVIRFRNTLGGEVSQDGVNWSQIDSTQPRITEDKPLSFVSEDAKVTVHGSHLRKSSISIRQTQPLPMTILAIRVKGKTSR